MWVIAGVLLGVVVLGALAGFHSGPHAHLAAGVAGAVAGIWLVIMALTGHSSSLLWVLLTADLIVSAGVGVTAWKGFSSARAAPASKPLEGTEGVAVSDLSPDGLVRVRGEQWSAVSVNGPARVGTAVQVLRASGVRLEVWSEEVEPSFAEPALPAAELFRLDSGRLDSGRLDSGGLGSGALDSEGGEAQ